jgi:uncharacterized protein (DUF2062 family)
MTESNATGPQPTQGFWTRLKLHVLHPELTPQQVALSFGIGLSICWNPLLGTHTGMVLGLCLLFRRLHRPLMFIAAFLNNPWTMVPIATLSTYFGNLLLGRGFNIDLAGVYWRDIGWRSFASREGFEVMYRMLKPILLPYLLGGGVLCILALPVGYLLALALTRRLRRMHLHMPHLLLPHFRNDAPKD